MAIYLCTTIWHHPRFSSLSLPARDLYLRSLVFVAQAHTGSALFQDGIRSVSHEDPRSTAAVEELVAAGLFARVEGWYVVRNLRGEPISVAGDPEIKEEDDDAGVWFVRPRERAEA